VPEKVIYAIVTLRNYCVGAISVKKILVIEDNDMLRQQIHIFLSEQNFDVISTTDGETGIQMAHEHVPHLILCDVRLPTVNGFEVLNVLQTSTNTRFIPVIFMSAMKDRQHIRQGMAHGGADYLTKPFTMLELATSIEACFQKYNRVEEKYDATLKHLRDNISYALPHELRTPLLGIIGYAEMLYEDATNLPPEQVQSYADGIMKSSQRLRTVIENYLAFAQLEILAHDTHSRQQLQQAACDAHQSIRTLAQKMARARPERKQDFVVTLTRATVRISCAHLEKIVGELLDNALKFSKPGTNVVLESEIVGNYLQIQLLDFGEGITTDELDKIGAFMQFNRIAKEQQGVGLGLAIVMRLVDLHNGTIQFESKPHMGTLVRVMLPLKTP
jgi:two-component system, sensor histidine kinase and response regulator